MKKFWLVFIFTIFYLAVSPMHGKEMPRKHLLKEVRKYRLSNEHKIINDFFQLLSIPNVSHDHENIKENAAFIKKQMEKREFQVQIIETPGNPVVYGERISKNAGKDVKTLLFYIHYDGQPVDPSKWIDSDPFKPVLRPGKMEAGSNIPKPIPLPPANEHFQDDWRVYARSASDDKAPITAALTAIDALKTARYPIKHHIKFILDGEEEAGSPNLSFFLKKYKHLLDADILLMCDGPGYFSGDPTFIFGVRGITSLSITVYGPNVSLHSGHYGNWTPNPALRLARLIAGMKDREGKVIIEGFYDTVTSLSRMEKEALDSIPPYDKDLMKLYGFSQPEGGSASLMETILKPSLNIAGLKSGWVGKDTRTIVPASATAAIDIRLAKGNDPADMVRKVIAHIQSRGYHVVNSDPDKETRMKYPFLAKVINTEKGYRAARTSMDLPISKRLINALKDFAGKKVVLMPSLGGSLPIYMFEDTLQIPFIGIPIANYDNNQHQPNENLRVGHLWLAIETFAAVLTM